MQVSKKYIVSIWYFIENYCNIIYSDQYKLTHKEMELYLWNNLNLVLKKCNFRDINREKILNGEVILVKDEVGKIIPYYNPVRCCSIDCFLKELSEVDSNMISLDNLDDCVDLKEIGKIDYGVYSLQKEKVLSKKERMVRRNYN